MISFLIPTYNYVCLPLVTHLHQQAEKMGITYEIIVADDCSTSLDTVAQNKAINQLSHCHFYVEAHNCGRADIRNRLGRKAKYPFVVFMDSDAQVVDGQFVERYVDSLKQLGSEALGTVVCGGVKNVESCPSPNLTLRYRYEKEADRHRSAAERNMHPAHKFTAFNMMMSRELFLNVQFDTQCKEYGYEDVLFGLELSQRSIPIHHIDNPLIHNGLDPNAIFLKKTETALRTLHHLPQSMQQMVQVSHLAAAIEQKHLAPVVKVTFKMVRPLLRWNLQGNHPSLFLFSLYKLCYYLCLKKEE